MNGFSFRTKEGSGTGGSNGRIKGEIGGTPFSGIGGCGVPSPVAPIPPTSTPALYNGTPPGDPSSDVPSTDTIRPGRPGCAPNVMTLPGPLNLLMSEKNKFDRPTPTSGPVAGLLTPGGKCC